MFEERALRSRWRARHIADKLALVICGLCAALMTRSLVVAIGLSIFWLFWNLVVHGHSWRTVFRTYAAAALFLVPTTLLVAVSVGPSVGVGAGAMFSMGLPGGWSVVLRRGDLLWACVLGVRALAAFGVLVFFALSTPVIEFTSALARLRVSPVLIELLIFTYRMFGLLGESAEQIVRAQEARLGYRDRRRVRRSVRLLVPAIVVRALHQVRRFAAGLDARGYRGRLEVLQPLRPFAPVPFFRALLLGVGLVVVAGFVGCWGISG